jgi:hypothetical protein
MMEVKDDGICKKHGLMACSYCVVITGAAVRMASIVNSMITFRQWDELVHGCMAFYLDDGDSDMTLYPDRKTALQYQLRPTCVFYFRSCPGGVSPRDCQIFLNINREAYKNDRIAWTDPQSPDLIISDYGAQNMRRRWN